MMTRRRRLRRKGDGEKEVKEEMGDDSRGFKKKMRLRR